MKKFLKPFSILLSFMFVILTLARPVQAASGARYELPFEVNAQSYLLVSLDTGEVIFEKNSRERYIPASLTKLLTAYTVYQYVEDLDGTMISAPRYVYDELYGLNGSTADIRQGETLSARQLLYAGQGISVHIPPAEISAVEWVSVALHGNFITVIYTWCAGQAEHQRIGA